MYIPCTVYCFCVVNSFDEYPASSWTLSRQPVDLLSSLRQHYMTSIIQQLQVVTGIVDPEVYDRAAVLVQYLCGLVRCVVYRNVCVFGLGGGGGGG